MTRIPCPSELIPDDEEGYDATLCAYCAKDLPENPEPGTPAWEGFCDRMCQEDAKKDPGFGRERP
jgi:hypothetical protein